VGEARTAGAKHNTCRSENESVAAPVDDAAVEEYGKPTTPSINSDVTVPRAKLLLTRKS
jgi:hypothetical protein